MRWWQRIVVWFSPHDRDEYYHVSYGIGGAGPGCRRFYNPYAVPVEYWWECTPTCRKALRRLCYLVPKARTLP